MYVYIYVCIYILLNDEFSKQNEKLIIINT
jgi:hypothetical protein